MIMTVITLFILHHGDDVRLAGVDGDWSAWSAWSVCTAECRQARHRDCDSPAPSHGGHFCFGVNSDSQDCLGDLCRRTAWMEPSIAEEEESAAPATSEIALYVGLSLAVVVFLVVVLVALSLLRRRRLPSGYRLTQSGALKLPVILVLVLLKPTISNDLKLVRRSKDFQSVHRQIYFSFHSFVIINEFLLFLQPTIAQKFVLIFLQKVLSLYEMNIRKSFQQLNTRRSRGRKCSPTVETL